MTDDELLRACGDRGFTPGARHVEALLEAWRAAPRGQKKTIVGALSATAEYEYIDRSSNLPSADYTENIITGGLKYDF